MTTVTPQAPQQQKPDLEPRSPWRWTWAVLAAMVALAAGLWLGLGFDSSRDDETAGADSDVVAPTDEPGDAADPDAPTDPTTSPDPAAPEDPDAPTPTNLADPVDSPQVPEPIVRTYDLTVADSLAEPVQGTVMVEAPWGDVGIDEAGFGPCCFDVYDVDSFVVLDAANLRILRFGAGEEPMLLAQWDAGDFVPDAVAVMSGRVVVLGMTNRTNRPHDAIALSLDTGEQLQRVETTVPMNVDLRSTTDGVFWAEPSSNPKWTAVADSAGELLAIADQVTTDYLPGETTLDWNWDAGISIAAQPAGDSPQTVYNVTEEQAVFGEVLRYQGWADGVIVLFGSEFDEDNRSTVQVFELGTARDKTVSANLYSVEIERWAETGSFGTFRYGFGALYVLNTTPEGMRIVRYDF